MGGATAKRLVLAVSLLGLTVVAAGQAAPFKTYIQKGNLRIAFWGHIAPRKLPRVGVGPVDVSISTSIATIDNSPPPQLRTIKLEINRNGRLDPRGLPACRFHLIQPASTAKARAACSAALVGHGTFQANVALPEQSPFPSNGEILAFNGRSHGKPVILAHIYGTEPLPTSFTLPFHIGHHRAGTYGLVLTAHLPQVAAEWGFIKGFSLTLGRRFRYRGNLHSYVSAGCPAPPGFPGSVFALARMHFGFDDGTTLPSTIVRDCHARG
jgi:hypothetical protein